MGAGGCRRDKVPGAAWRKAEECGTFVFFALGDPQINIPKWGTKGTEETIADMNALPGKPFPFGGTVAEPLAVLVAGDLVDDIANPENWKRYSQFFDVRGRGRLRFPVIEWVGNHDLIVGQAYGAFSPVQREVIARNLQRPGHFHYGPNRYHHSWDWGPVHFVCLHLFPGNTHRPVYDRPSPWNDPKNSLDFLRKDLAERVGDSGRPVFLLWHYGLAGWGLEKWWTPEDLANLKAVLKPYNVLLILHGHEHAYRRYTWAGYDVVMAPAPQIDPNRDAGEQDGLPKGYLVFRATRDALHVAHRMAGTWRERWTKPLHRGRTR
jgi:hypothetical protein